MKKLLLVLMVVALASFLLVGCLPGTTPDDDEDEPEDEDEGEVAIEVGNYYFDSLTGKTYVNGLDDPLQDVVVTVPDGAEEGYLVYVAVKWYDESTGEYYYTNMQEATSPDGIIWTAADYDFSAIVKWDPVTEAYVPIDDCEVICLVALLKHPCCPGEEIAMKILTVDKVDPYTDLYVTVKDCEDPCVTEDPCALAIPGAYIEWTSRAVTECAVTDCCGDDCSGIGSWSIEVDPDPCLGPCDLVTGETCPVEGVLDCGCLTYDDPATDFNEGIHEIKFTLLDNVGNIITNTWILTFDTDSLVSFTVDDVVVAPVDGVYPVITGSCLPVVVDIADTNGI